MFVNDIIPSLTGTESGAAVELSTHAAEGLAVGTDFGKLGTVVDNPGMQISGINDYAAARAAQRGMTAESMESVVSSPTVVLQQSNGTRLFLSDEGAVVLNQDGRVVTTYSPANFDENVTAVLRAAKNGH